MKDEELYKLVGKMTLQEKIGQLVQVLGDVFLYNAEGLTGPLKDLGLSNEMLYNVGSILNVMGTDKIREIQEKYLSKSRLKIPLLFMSDIINGYKIILPIPLAQGCSWDSKVVYNCAKLAAKEAKVARSKC